MLDTSQTLQDRAVAFFRPGKMLCAALGSLGGLQAQRVPAAGRGRGTGPDWDQDAPMVVVCHPRLCQPLLSGAALLDEEAQVGKPLWRMQWGALRGRGPTLQPGVGTGTGMGTVPWPGPRVG